MQQLYKHKKTEMSTQMSVSDNELIKFTSSMTPRLRVGLIGDPVAHSFSPSIQQAAFEALKIYASYELWHTPASQLVERVRSLCDKAYLGANVTIPHKAGVLPLL